MINNSLFISIANECGEKILFMLCDRGGSVHKRGKKRNIIKIMNKT
jgi:hypothetical protein